MSGGFDGRGRCWRRWWCCSARRCCFGQNHHGRVAFNAALFCRTWCCSRMSRWRPGSAWTMCRSRGPSSCSPKRRRASGSLSDMRAATVRERSMRTCIRRRAMVRSRASCSRWAHRRWTLTTTGMGRIAEDSARAGVVMLVPFSERLDDQRDPARRDRRARRGVSVLASAAQR